MKKEPRKQENLMYKQLTLFKEYEKACLDYDLPLETPDFKSSLRAKSDNNLAIVRSIARINSQSSLGGGIYGPDKRITA